MRLLLVAGDVLLVCLGLLYAGMTRLGPFRVLCLAVVVWALVDLVRLLWVQRHDRL